MIPARAPAHGYRCGSNCTTRDRHAGQLTYRGSLVQGDPGGAPHLAGRSLAVRRCSGVGSVGGLLSCTSAIGRSMPEQRQGRKAEDGAGVVHQVVGQLGEAGGARPGSCCEEVTGDGGGVRHDEVSARAGIGCVLVLRAA